MFLAVAVNLGLTIVQVIGGVLSGSLSLIADALHNFSDAISLIIAFGARRIARRPRDERMTFGYGRIEVVAALINYTTLIVIGLYLSYEAVTRFIEPQPVAGWIVVIVAGIALVVDVATAMLTYALSKESMNIRAAFLHNVADALGSVAVIVAGTLILLYDWRLVDPIVTLMIAGYILWQSFREIGPVVRILMLGSPPDIEPEAVLAATRGVRGRERRPPCAFLADGRASRGPRRACRHRKRKMERGGRHQGVGERKAASRFRARAHDPRTRMRAARL